MISIVIPVYNRGQAILSTIDSYLAQKDVKEIVIVNDGSTDNTAELIGHLTKRSRKIKLIAHKQNRGLPAARNTGVEHSHGTEYVMFGEDDVWLSLDYCKTLLSHLQTSGAHIIAGRLIGVRSTPREKVQQEIAVVGGPLISYATFTGDFSKRTDGDVVVPFVHSCALIKRTVFDDCRYDEHTFKVTYFREETDFYIRAQAKGYKIVFCPHTVAYHLSTFWDPKTLGQSGCRPTSKLKSRLWRQKNNAAFAWKNRDILSSLGIDYRVFVMRFLLIGLSNALRDLIGDKS